MVLRCTSAGPAALAIVAGAALLPAARAMQPTDDAGLERAAATEVVIALGRAVVAGDIDELFAHAEGVLGKQYLVDYLTASVRDKVFADMYGSDLNAYLDARPLTAAAIARTTLKVTATTALPMAWRGEFEADRAAITTASLVLATHAVEAASDEIHLLRLRGRANRARNASRWTKAGGAASAVTREVAIYFFSTTLEDRLFAYWELRQVREALDAAIHAFLRDMASGGSVDQALSVHSSAWWAYRTFLAEGMQEIRRDRDDCLADVQQSILRIRNSEPTMTDALEGSPAAVRDSFARVRLRLRQEQLEDMTACLDGYAAAAIKVTAEIYMDARRESGFVTAGGEESADAPAPDDVRFEQASGNRLQSYEDEIEVLGLARGYMVKAGRAQSAALLSEYAEDVQALMRIESAIVTETQPDGVRRSPSPHQGR